jgi:hypothetical protein
MAAPEPAIVQSAGQWTLDVTFEQPLQISLQTKAGTQRFWYTILTLTNKTGADVDFYPKCELMTDTLEIIPSGRGVSPAVFEMIKKRHQRAYPLLEPIEKVGDRILQGADNARDIAIVWPEFDPAANNIKLFISGLSNETAVVKHPTKTDEQGRPVDVYLRKTLVLSYDLPSDGISRLDVKLKFEEKSWVMR